MKLPLEGVTVLEFSQYLAGPYAGLRLADLGARVIKIERPKYGDACRGLVTKNMISDGDSVLFHTINRNKDSFQANLKDANDVATVKKLAKSVDIITHNFRPGIMERLGLNYEVIKEVNPTIIYAEVSGYGAKGPWKDKPGQDLLAQSMSGLTWLSGNDNQPPMPFGIATADMICGTQLVQALCAALLRRKRKGIGAKIEVSLMESILDLQFEGLTAYLNTGKNLPERCASNNGHVYLGAPYGIYKTKDTYIALAMGKLSLLNEALKNEELAPYCEGDLYFTKRNEVKAIIASQLVSETTAYWCNKLDSVGFWHAPVFNYEQLTKSEVYTSLNMQISLERNGETIKTTRCPIRLNQQILSSNKSAPVLGETTERIKKEYKL